MLDNMTYRTCVCKLMNVVRQESKGSINIVRWGIQLNEYVRIVSSSFTARMSA